MFGGADPATEADDIANVKFANKSGRNDLYLESISKFSCFLAAKF